MIKVRAAQSFPLKQNLTAKESKQVPWGFEGVAESSPPQLARYLKSYCSLKIYVPFAFCSVIDPCCFL